MLVNRVRSGLRVYWLLQRTSLRGALQYRLNTLVMLLAGAAYQGVGFAFLWIMLDRFSELAGWTLGEVAFLYGMRLLAHALWLTAASGIVLTDQFVREGDLERMLLRPVNLLAQIVTGRRAIEPYGDLLMAVVLCAVASRYANIDWSIPTAVFFLLAVTGGALIEFSAQLVVAALSFRILQTWALRGFVDDTMSILGSYPLAVFGKATQRALTYALPVAFVAYLPATLLTNQTGELTVPVALGYATPLVGVASFTLAYLFWRHQARGYRGVGH